MPVKPRYSVKKYILLGTSGATLGLWIAMILLSLIGFPAQALLLVVLGCFPVALFACLTGFHKGLVTYYGFKEPQFHRKQDPKSGDMG